MALSIKTEEADRLARELARRTGESMTQAVTVALRERLERVPDNEPGPIDKSDPRWRAEVDRLLSKMRVGLDPTPMTKADWDSLTDDGIKRYLGGGDR